LVTKYYDFIFIAALPESVSNTVLNGLNCGLSPLVPLLATPRLIGASFNYQYKPHFKKPFKTTFNADSGRAAIKIRITVLNNQATSYIYLNSYTDPA